VGNNLSLILQVYCLSAKYICPIFYEFLMKFAEYKELVLLITSKPFLNGLIPAALIVPVPADVAFVHVGSQAGSREPDQKKRSLLHSVRVSKELHPD